MPPVYMKANSTGICTALLNPKVLPIQVSTPSSFLKTPLTLNPFHPFIKGLIIEFMVTGALILLVCAVWDERNSDKVDTIAIKFGLFIVMVAIVAGPLTSAALNPARAFAPAYFNDDWRDHWVCSETSVSILTDLMFYLQIYVAGPLSAGVVFTLAYLFLFRETQREPIISSFMREDQFQVPIELTSHLSNPKQTI